MLSQVRRQVAVLMATVAAFSLGLSGLVTSSASAAGTTQGVTSKSVTLGLLVNLTGSLASSFSGTAMGAQARIDEQNAKGGVDGRKIKLVIGDDQSLPTDSLSVTQSLVQEKHAFAVMEETAFFALDYKYLEQAGIPGIAGQPYDGGPEWPSKSTTDLVDAAGSQSVTSGNYGWLIKMLKTEHCTKLATVANGASAAGVQYANEIKQEAEAAGIQDVDEDNSLGFTQTDLTPNATTMKNSGANCWVGITAAFAEEALLTALQQQGANVKGVLLGNYSASFLQPPVNSDDQGMVTSFWYKTPEIDPSAANQIGAAERKYTGYTGTTPLTTGSYFGWIAADAAITGLEAAGKNLTATRFLNGLHKTKAYTAGGLQAPVNLAVSKQGTYATSTAGSCMYALKVVGTKYVPVTKKPFCS
jgi:ABC-type branched-subunit amino acid transport system substrate-binding protein